MTQSECLLIDYGVGNIFSITQAIEACGFNVKLSRDSKEIREATHVILPGVGAFAHAKEKLDAFELSEPLIDYASNGGYLLGICLGMQLLFSRSFEYGTHEGLNVIQGDVDCIKNRASTIRVPLIGWHPLHGVKDSNLFNDIDEQNYCFVHSFECLPKDDQLLSSYVLIDNLKICSSVSQGNISGVQFHPEKSGVAGLKFLNNFMSQN